MPTSSINVLVTMPFPAYLLERLEAVSPRLNVMQREARTAADYADLVEDIQVLYTFKALPLPEEAPALRWVQMHSAGAESILEHRLYTETDIQFTTTSGIHAINMAEYVLAQMLVLSHRMLRMFEDKALHTWTDHRWDRYVPHELYGATVGIVGYGSVGRQVARLASAFGMQVLAVKRDARSTIDDGFTLPGIGDPEGDIPDRIYPPPALHSFLRECDYVVLTVPLTRKTRALIDRAALDAMRHTAVLINVARGGVIDEKALVEALREGQIAGAALDVFEQEPLPEDSPLWNFPNVIISPHVSGFTPYYDDRAVTLFTENLRRYILGESLINVVKRDRDY